MAQSEIFTEDSWENPRLWQHQIDAIKMVRGYQKSGAERSALVRMPTGTGKSGIIAILARCFEDTENVLVIAPFVFIRDQLIWDIRERFWEKIKVDPNLWVKKIDPIIPSTIEIILQQSERENSIFVCTIQTLQEIYVYDKTSYNRLKERISLVIFDEGHREPSPEWAKAVRDLQKHTVLFTATPYRNDHKMFDVDHRHVFPYTHQAAIQDKVIREIKFCETENCNSPIQFVDNLLTFYYNEFRKFRPSDIEEPRVIIRCKSPEDIKIITRLLEDKGKKVIAIHEDFPIANSGIYRKKVPDPKKTDAIFWVHQYKLIEGIDDSRFCLLAIYQPFSNARALVQQIGRIIRNSIQGSDQKGVVFTQSIHRQKSFWEGYLKYESKYESNPELYGSRQLFTTITQIQPDYQYFEGNYRAKFDIDGVDLYKQFRYPLTTNVFEIPTDFPSEDIETALKKEMLKTDRDFFDKEVEHPDPNTYLIPYVTYGNSPIFQNHALFEYKVGFTFFHIKKNYLFFYDSQGNSSDYLQKNAKRVPPNSLEFLFKGNKARISEISLMNMDLGRHSIRRRTLHAHSIEDTAPGLVDYAHFISTARGYSTHEKNRLTKRYIGFTRARISDPSSQRFEFHDYIKWLDTLAETLSHHSKKSIAIFDRFASFTNPPLNPKPRNIFIDMDQVLNTFETSSPTSTGKIETLSFDDLSFDI
ncbi:MAG: DEAD/DEAH box helicase family protein, partial [Ignavibacteria bacterium]|nr:DEAD/DEAH box helicase family protein [Ignavibacteria bacterium]